MKRPTYKNGHKTEFGDFGGCDGCDVVMINGRLCHEHGCNHAWKDKLVDCRNCGYGFYPQEKNEQFCWHCRGL